METPRHIRYADLVTSVEISSAALAAIRAHAARDPAREVCGLLLGTDGEILSSRPVDNVAPDPGNRFEIDPAALFEALRAERAGGPSLLGYYHSHPHGAAEPSEIDREMAPPDGKVWIIVAGYRVRGWRAGPGGLQEIALRLSSQSDARSDACSSRTC